MSVLTNTRRAHPGAGRTAGVQLRRPRPRLTPAVAAVLLTVTVGEAQRPVAAAPPVSAPVGGRRAARAERPGRPVQPGRVEFLRLPSGDADGSAREVWVYRPPGPDRADLPVLYFLHGYPGTDRNAEMVGLAAVLDEAIAATGRAFVVAFPDGGSTIHPDTEWANSVDGKVRLERFVTTTVIRGVEGSHRRDRHHRAIAGFSMGGYGAMNLGLRHPGLYGQVVSISGYFHPDDPDRMGGGRAGWAAANRPDRLLGRAWRTRLLLLDAEQEHDPLIKGEATRFAGLARRAGLHPSLVVAPGRHTWAMVMTQVPTIARFLDTGWPRPRRAVRPRRR
jgi:predicted esterase